jgi:hypothetical protein
VVKKAATDKEEGRIGIRFFFNGEAVRKEANWAPQDEERISDQRNQEHRGHRIAFDLMIKVFLPYIKKGDIPSQTKKRVVSITRGNWLKDVGKGCAKCKFLKSLETVFELVLLPCAGLYKCIE